MSRTTTTRLLGFTLRALLLLAPAGATQDAGCASDPAGQGEVAAPGDPAVNQGAQGRVNATVEEQQSAGPATRKPNLP